MKRHYCPIDLDLCGGKQNTLPKCFKGLSLAPNQWHPTVSNSPTIPHDFVRRKNEVDLVFHATEVILRYVVQFCTCELTLRSIIHDFFFLLWVISISVTLLKTLQLLLAEIIILVYFFLIPWCNLNGTNKIITGNLKSYPSEKIKIKS